MASPREKPGASEAARRSPPTSTGALEGAARLAWVMAFTCSLSYWMLRDDLAFSVATFVCFVSYPIGVLISIARGSSINPVSTTTASLVAIGWLLPGVRRLLVDALGMVISSHYDKIGEPASLLYVMFLDNYIVVYLIWGRAFPRRSRPASNSSRETS